MVSYLAVDPPKSAQLASCVVATRRGERRLVLLAEPVESEWEPWGVSSAPSVASCALHSHNVLNNIENAHVAVDGWKHI